MDENRENHMTIRVYSNEKIAETSSKGNQEKWYDDSTDRWYKVDQFGYEALAETLVSMLLEKSNIRCDMPFQFVNYSMEHLVVHGRERTGCSSRNFLREGESIITVSRLISQYLEKTLSETFGKMTSDKNRIKFLVETVSEITGLEEFSRYLTLLFEIDSLFLNDDRHLNNIAVIEKDGRFSYCPIFDNGAALLSNTQYSPMDIEPRGLIKDLVARPFNMSFNRQRNTMVDLYGNQLQLPKLSKDDIDAMLEPLLQYYPNRDRAIIRNRVEDCIMIRQRYHRSR